MHKLSNSPDLLEVFIKGMNEVFLAEQLSVLVPSNLPETHSGKTINPIENLLIAAERQFGIISASGLFFRCGGAAFKHLVRKYGKAAEIDSLEFRLQPQQKRLRNGVVKLIQLLETWQAGKFSIKRSDDLVEITASASGLNVSNAGGQIWLHFIAGLFQEYLYWAGSGKQYPFQIIAQDQPGKEIIIQFRNVPVD
ncbi:MAG: hypothetical protein WCG34_02425 [Leptolinea sp.]